MGFIDTMRAEGHAVESVCRVLREQGCQVAARTYRLWRTGQPAPRTVSDAVVVDMVRDAAWKVDDTGRRRLTPEGLYGRRKMTESGNALLVWLGGHRRISPVSGSTWLPSTRRRLGRAVGSARRAARWCWASCWVRVVTSLP